MCKLLLITVLAATAAAFVGGCAAVKTTESMALTERSNESLVRAGFDRWRAGTGGPFELLADDARWTIVGSSPVSKTYLNKEQFMTEVIRPFNARMDQPLKPSVRNLYSDWDTVIVLFDAEARCVDGLQYRNTYVWFMHMKDGHAINVTAFFDT